MKVLKRNGDLEDVRFDKITERIQKLSDKEPPLKNIDAVKITQQVSSQLKEEMTTKELDELSAEICISMITKHPDFGDLAMRITIDNHQKNTPRTFKESMSVLYHNKDLNGKESSLISDKIYQLSQNNSDEIEKVIDYNRDFDFDYFGFKTLQRAYLLKSGGKLIEKSQHMWMRVALGIHGDDLEKGFHTYEMLSKKNFIHATPTLFHAGTPRPKLSSCFLLGSEDSVEGMYKTITDCARISKWAGGIGLHLSNIRSRDSYIRGTGGKSSGIVPLLKVLNATARHINQSGKRLGSIAIYLEPWHADIFSFMEAKKNHGAEEERARDLFYALWIPDLFMKCVESDGDWYLMCPDKSPGLCNVYGEKFEELYEKYKKEGKYTKKIKARELWNEIINSQIETGLPYMVYKDACNEKSNQKNIGVIKSSNLCVGPHTLILTDGGYLPIHIMVDMKANVWNGEEFSESIIMKTGEKQKMLEVRFTNGTSIQCTPEHDFYIQQDENVYKLKAKKLKEGMEMIKCNYPVVNGGYSDKDVESNTTIPLNFDLESKIRWLQKVIDEKIFFENSMSYGAIHFSTTNRLDLLFFQFLLQTLGISSEIIIKKDKYMTIINSKKLGKLQQLGLKIEDFEEVSCDDDAKIRIQYVKEMEELSDTYCFNEPKKHMGVFNGILAGNCTEIIQYSDSKEYAVCNLASISLPNFLAENKKIDLLRNTDEIIKVYSKSNCDYCTLSKTLLRKNGIEFFEEKLDDDDDKSIFFDKLNCKDGVCITGNKKIKTVPQIFIGDDHIGGYNELLEYLVPTFDHQKLYDITATITENLNKIIDINYYPTEETRVSNMRHRPIGIGVQGLADLFLKMKLAFDSQEAAKLNREVFETIYFSALETSMLLAKKTSPYETFKGSPISEGKFQFDLWKQETILSDRWDWERLREDVIKHGVKNSLLIAPMPTASTSQILGNNECIEPYTSNIYTRRTLAGEFIVMNKHLIHDLLDNGLWNEDMKQKIIKLRGSIQQIPEIPNELKKIFKTSWEIKQKVLLDLSIDRGQFVCQSQSLNVFCEDPTYQTLSKIHFYGWKNGLKTGTYYIRSKPKVNSQQFTVDLNECENCSA